MTRFEQLRKILDTLSDESHYLFSLEYLSSIFSELDKPALKNLVSRSARKEIIERICSGVYLNPRAPFHPGYLLYHTAALLRASCFSYLSMESVLSDAGIISQVPISWISLMTSGRSYTFDCGKWGTIEFVHTKKKPATLVDQISYDSTIRLWRASVPLAVQDMKDAGRPLDLIDWGALEEKYEFI
jgi:predicted transcriptional regulator of viral defense system